MKEELLKGLTDEQIAKIKACKNQEEMLQIAKEEGVELTDEQLEAVSGGCITWSRPVACPNCQSTNTEWIWNEHPRHRHCHSCGHNFNT